MRKRRRTTNCTVSLRARRCSSHAGVVLEKCETFEEENRQVHNINTSTITRLQELESTSSQLQVRVLAATDLLSTAVRSESRISVDPRTAAVHRTIASLGAILDRNEESVHRSANSTHAIDRSVGIHRRATASASECHVSASERLIDVRSSLVQQRSLEVGIDEKNEAILNLDRQLRERTQRIEQVSPLPSSSRCYSSASRTVASRPPANCSSNGKSTDRSQQDHPVAQGNSQEASAIDLHLFLSIDSKRGAAEEEHGTERELRRTESTAEQDLRRSR